MAHDDLDCDHSFWPYSPIHRFDEEAEIFMITGATVQKNPYFKTKDRLTFLQKTLIVEASKHNWVLQAWAVFSNHYHFIAKSSAKPVNIRQLIKNVHSKTAMKINEEDNTQGRRVWSQYSETKLTNPKSYLARLSYVHRNAVTHKIVENPKDYPWCSAGWFENTCKISFVGSVYKSTSDSIIEDDEF